MCRRPTVPGSFVTGRNDLFHARMPGLARERRSGPGELRLRSIAAGPSQQLFPAGGCPASTASS